MTATYRADEVEVYIGGKRIDAWSDEIAQCHYCGAGNTLPRILGSFACRACGKSLESVISIDQDGGTTWMPTEFEAQFEPMYYVWETVKDERVCCDHLELDFSDLPDPPDHQFRRFRCMPVPVQVEEE